MMATGEQTFFFLLSPSFQAGNVLPEDKLDWKALKQRKLKAPFVPPSFANFDERHVTSKFACSNFQPDLKTKGLFSDYNFGIK